METGKKEKHCRYFKAKVLQDHGAENLTDEVRKSIGEQSVIFSDQSTSYVDVASFIELHITKKSTKETTQTTLK